VVESRGSRAVWRWRWNEHGNLGSGSLDDVNVPVKICDGPRRIAKWAACSGVACPFATEVGATDASHFIYRQWDLAGVEEGGVTT
jgi:hypothetical protein